MSCWRMGPQAKLYSLNQSYSTSRTPDPSQVVNIVIQSDADLLESVNYQQVLWKATSEHTSMHRQPNV